jgi:hypothetical protein
MADETSQNEVSATVDDDADLHRSEAVQHGAQLRDVERSSALYAAVGSAVVLPSCSGGEEQD